MLTFKEYILIYKSAKKISNEKNTPKRIKKKMKLSMKGKKLQIPSGPKTWNS